MEKKNSFRSSQTHENSSDSYLILYKTAADIIKQASKHKKGVRSLIYSSNIKQKHSLSIIVWNVLKQRQVLSAIFKNATHFSNEFPGNKYLAWAIIYQLLFGRKNLIGQSSEEKIALKHEDELKEQLEILKSDAEQQGIELIPENTDSVDWILLNIYYNIMASGGESGPLRTLLFYSFLMITCPIGTFFITKSAVEMLGVETNYSYLYATGLSVVVVHIILGMFVYVAYKEDESRAKRD